MRRRLKILGLSIAIAAILAPATVSTVSAAGNDSGTGTQNQGAECRCGECPCGDCARVACDPVNHAYKHDYSSPGPHGLQYGK